MKIQKIIIHNLRSIKHQEFYLSDYSLLIGENNAGKSNVIRALRIFYDLEKYNEGTDFPKFSTEDKESWIEIEFLTDDVEQDGLKDVYRSPDNLLRVRKVLMSKTQKDLVKPSQSNIYAYEEGSLSTNLFYGAKNISQSKLGSVIFIPELSKVDESMKMSGPSPLRNMLNFVIKKVMDKSVSYSQLNNAFGTFNDTFKNETKDGFSINEIVDSINTEMKGWNVKIGIDINPVQAEDIIKNLVSHYVEDGNLDNQKVNIDSFGQGLQRHLIYALLRLSANYEDTKETTKKEFAPDFNLILFEEPEAFLHPTQQAYLNSSLIKLSSNPNHQLLITTHSPIFVSKNIENLSDMIIVKRDGETKLYQFNKSNLAELYDDNAGLYKLFHRMCIDPTTTAALKSKIKGKGLASDTEELDIKLEEETFKYALWIDGERATAFFAKHVIIAEGASEKVFIDLLLNTKWSDLFNKHIFILDAMGKFNIHRYMNLFGKLGIRHSVLMDKDVDVDIHSVINDFIKAQKNKFTCQIKWFEKDIEDFLGITTPLRKDLKPLNILKRFSAGELSEDKISELKILIEELLD